MNDGWIDRFQEAIEHNTNKNNHWNTFSAYLLYTITSDKDLEGMGVVSTSTAAKSSRLVELSVLTTVT